mmetsp:Transcript_13721/g.25427  ORF Transcript_13721/g.25427 Transcript_13721/m.25427 type:complete len:89 (-) Transcript_13721:1127-1393(-)
MIDAFIANSRPSVESKAEEVTQRDLEVDSIIRVSSLVDSFQCPSLQRRQRFVRREHIIFRPWRHRANPHAKSTSAARFQTTVRASQVD